jgi:cytochrome c-type biogenesis protein CcmH/NrfF
MSRQLMLMGRREALRSLGLVLPALLGGRALHAQDVAAPQAPRAGQGDVGELFNPQVAGKSRAPTVAGDNDERYKQLEQTLQCTCGCTLDIYTCRTTDFTCEFSPRLHKEVLALGAQGKSDAQIVEAFVAKYGEKVLMAPKPQGFNLAGYIVPGIVIALIGALVTWVIMRRIRRNAEPAMAGAPAGTPAPGGSASSMSEADAERVRRALEEIET